MSAVQLIPTWEEMTLLRHACHDLIDAGVALGAINDNDYLEFCMYFDQYMVAIQSIRDLLGPLAQPSNLPPGKRMIYGRSLAGWPGLVRSQFRILENRFDELCRKLDLDALVATWTRLRIDSDGRRMDACGVLGFQPGQDSGPSLNLEADRHPTIDATYDSFERAVTALDAQLDALRRANSPGFLYSTLPESPEASQDPETLADGPELVATVEPSEKGTAATGTEASGRKSKAPAARPLVFLGKPSDQPSINGRIVPRLSVARRDILKALFDAGEKGLTGEELVEKSRHGGAVNTLKAIARDPDWEVIILLPRQSGKRYRVFADLTDIDGH